MGTTQVRYDMGVRSEPAFHDDTRGVHVPVQHEAAPTPVRPFRQRLRDDPSARGAFLAAVPGSHPHDLPTGACSLVGGHAGEFPPASVEDGACELVVPDHVLDLQVLEHDESRATNSATVLILIPLATSVIALTKNWSLSYPLFLPVP